MEERKDTRKSRKTLYSGTCSVCGDSGSGIHYGVRACYGCKGFFRRTVSRKLLHICRSNWDCTITKEGRNQCKGCRYRRCLQMGMRKDDVKEEHARNSMSVTSPDNDYFSGVSQPSITVPLLVEADKAISLDSKSFMTRTNCIANIQDVFESMRLELMRLVDWAQQLPCFLRMDKATRITLLRAHSSELTHLEKIRRSLEFDGYLLLANGAIAPCRDDPGTEPGAEARRRTIALLRSAKALRLTDPEILCLKALLLFDPEAPGLSDEERGFVESIRHQISVGFEMWVTGNLHGEGIGRMTKIMLLLPKVQRLAETFNKIKGTARKRNLVQIPKLVDDLVIEENNA